LRATCRSPRARLCSTGPDPSSPEVTPLPASAAPFQVPARSKI
jgi:hypothetical protein